MNWQALKMVGLYWSIIALILLTGFGLGFLLHSKIYVPVALICTVIFLFISYVIYQIENTTGDNND